MNNQTDKIWDSGRRAKIAKKDAADRITKTKVVPQDKIVELLECVMNPGDIVAMEGDNQK
jgi:malonate decarboxylase alpha subunit